MTPTLRYLGLYALYVAGIHVIPGPWLRWSRGRLLDNWTWTHVAWGYVAQRMGVSRGTTVALAATNEAFEAWLRANRPDLLWGTPETPRNVVLDVATTWAGWELGRLGVEGAIGAIGAMLDVREP